MNRAPDISQTRPGAAIAAPTPKRQDQGPRVQAPGHHPATSVSDGGGAGMTLLLLAPATPEPLVRAAEARGIPLTVLDLIGTDFAARHPTEAVLVRPDQYVAWCGSFHGLDAPALLDTVRGATT